MHIRYIYHMHFLAFIIAVPMGAAAWMASPAYASTPLLAQAQQYVAQQLDTYLDNAGHRTVAHAITVMSPRGAALEACPSGWQWEPLDLRQWTRIHIGVKCQGQSGSLVAIVHAQAPVWVTAQSLPQGHLLQTADVEQRIQAITNANELNESLTWLDRTLRKPLAAGTAIQAKHLAAQVYARKGDKLEIRASVDGVTVSVLGMATRTAYAGEIVRVRNLSSQQWVTGRLTAPGVLEPTEHPSGGVKVQLSD
jgi:flagella basal body P-ring formation protein FlgA